MKYWNRQNKGQTTLPAFVSFILLLLVSCTEIAPSPSPQLAYYHWQTAFAPDSLASAYLRRTSTLYLKAFDLVWSEGAVVPTALLQMDTTALPPEMRLIPAVFITNEAMRKFSPAGAPELAKRLVAKVNELLYHHPYPELQLDCDWTATTRENYFSVLREVKKLLPAATRLSVTLRLHQWKDPETTGVPPADRALLMCYNVGRVQDWREENSIVSLEAAGPYLNAAAYPLPLDVGLPLFRWGVLFREGEMIRLINELGPYRLLDTSRFELTAPGRYRVRESTYLGNYYLYRGDRLRLETVTPADLTAWAGELARHEWPDDLRVVFFHLGSPLLLDFTHAELQSLAVTCGGG